MASFPTLIYMQDPTGAWFTFNVNTGGAGFTITAASAPTPPPTPTIVTQNVYNITVKMTMEWAKRFASNRPSNIGTGVQPAITNANLILQTILGAPFRWRWNRVVTGFYTTAGQQDYYIFNWVPSTQVGLGWVTVDVYGNSQVVTVAGTTGLSTPAWNNTVSGTTVDGTGGTPVTWTNLGNLATNGGGVQTSINYNFGFIEGCAVQDQTVNVNGNGPQWKEISPEIWLSETSELALPRFISAQGDDGSGNISFRLNPVPDTAYPVRITIQQKAPVIDATSDTWTPIPDDYSRLYEWGFLALMLLFAGDQPGFQLANQMFIGNVLGVQQGLDETQRNIFLNNWNVITSSFMQQGINLQQGTERRSV